MSATTSTTPPNIYPDLYNFPPFFTRQPNTTTFAAQLHAWSTFILTYCRHHRLFTLELSTALDSDLFHNKALNRRLKPADAVEVLEAMRKDGLVEWVDGATRSTVLVYWRKPAEWAEVLYRWVESVGQKGSVLTLWELVNGEMTEGEEFHGMHPMVLQSVLAVMVKRGQAQTIGTEIDEMGVKFF
ncbi:ESCRT-II complex, vps25 subunit [Ascodesmis nigricans]|uniref:Vacuolar protein-sorting-associated protein 25 n=1 Tax=Ascodesmis nigricans TaxID=341454 RepID=A0A4S2N3V3_9PEZI|nr:ESCRT-II complex, vps25 subunit [Ascodesmis nigricans]